MEKTTCAISDVRILNISTDSFNVLHTKEEKNIKEHNKGVFAQHCIATIVALFGAVGFLGLFSFIFAIPFVEFFTPSCSGEFFGAILTFGISIMIALSFCDSFKDVYDMQDCSLQYVYKYYTKDKNILKAEYFIDKSCFGTYCSLWLDVEDRATHQVKSVRIGSFYAETKTNVSEYTFDLEAEKAYIPYKREVI